MWVEWAAFLCSSGCGGGVLMGTLRVMGTGSEQPLELAAGSENCLPVPGLGLPTLSQGGEPKFHHP